MGNFQRNDNRGGGYSGGRDSRGGGFSGGRGGDRRGGFGGGDRGGDRDRSVTMHKATCADCGKSCEVPFRPSGDKPVFCSECFGSKREAGDRGDRKEFNREPRREFNSRPTSSNSGQEELKKQLAEVNTKLDKLIGVVEKLLESKKEGAAGVGSSETKIKTKSEPKKTLKAVVKKALKK